MRSRVQLCFPSDGERESDINFIDALDDLRDLVAVVEILATELGGGNPNLTATVAALALSATEDIRDRYEEFVKSQRAKA